MIYSSRHLFFRFVIVASACAVLFLVFSITKKEKTPPAHNTEIAELFPGYEIGSWELDGKAIPVVFATSEQQRRQGLSGTPYLPDGWGMLFVFPQEAPHGFWMKDMNYSIDIFWFDNDKELVHSEKNVSPDTFPQSFGGEIESRWVLEVASE